MKMANQCLDVEVFGRDLKRVRHAAWTIMYHMIRPDSESPWVLDYWHSDLRPRVISY